MMEYWRVGNVRLARPTCVVGLLVLYLAQVASAVESRRVFEFATKGVTFSADFDGARLNDCVLLDDGTYKVVIRPENEPINDSAWYAFQVASAMPQVVTIHLAYEGGKHRYHPKISTDGKIWRRLSGDCYRRDTDNVTLQLDVGPEPIWISAQEMIGVAELEAWTDKIAQLPFVEQSVIGRSVGGRPIRQVTIRSGEPRYAVAIVGRQHPPEVTGSMALMEFVETITGASELAKEFRESCETLVVPLMNPDGVAAGNWRHNLNGVDLNRDWGPFLQPETRAARDSILRQPGEDAPSMAFFLDFHSTQNDVFYVQIGEGQVWSPGLSERWLDALAAEMPQYKVRQEPSAGTRPLSKVWARSTMEVPAVIYEVGDNTDRRLIREVARAAAEHMMSLLLEEIEGELIGSGRSGEALPMP